MESPVAESTLACLQTFDNLCTLKPSSPETEKLNIYLVDSNSRFRLWAGNLGAFHPISDPKSADYRLRHAPTIVKNTTDVLNDLRETLEDIEAILTGERIDESLNVNNTNIDILDDEAQPTSELQELVTSLPDLITSLLKISIFVRQNTTRDRYAKAEAAYHKSTFLPEFDIRHVADKFPKAEPWLQARLGTAITKRREFLRYVRDHHDKIARPATTLALPTTRDIAKQTAPDATVTGSSHPSGPAVSSEPTLAHTTASTLPASTIPVETSYDLDDEFDDGKSQATSLVSSRAADEDSDKLHVVQLHEIQGRGPEFECPYCFGMVRARKNSSWKKHVFRDLRAYTCTHKDCEAGLFEDRKAWFQHEMDHHRREWVCIMCPSRTFASTDDLHTHITTRHKEFNATKGSINSVLQASSIPVSEIAASSCPLCDDWDTKLRLEATDIGQVISPEKDVMVPVTQFRRHLADHQEQLALFAAERIQQDTARSEGSSYSSDLSQSKRLEDLKNWQMELDSTSRELRTEFDDIAPLYFKLHPSSFFTMWKVLLVMFDKELAQSDDMGVTMPVSHDVYRDSPYRFMWIRKDEYGVHHYCGQGDARCMVVLHTTNEYWIAVEIRGDLKLLSSTIGGSNIGMAYSGEQPPERIPGDFAPQAVRIIPDDSRIELAPKLGIDFGQLYKLKYDLNVRSFGFIAADSTAAFGEEISRANGIALNDLSRFTDFHPAPVASKGVARQWFVPGEGIDRNVIQSEIHKYLGSYATVTSGTGRGENSGVQGYWIKSYRNLKSGMIAELKAKSKERREQRMDHFSQDLARASDGSVAAETSGRKSVLSTDVAKFDLLKVSEDLGVTLSDQSNQVSVKYLTSPPQATTDPDLLSQGITARRILCATSGDAEMLFPEFRIRHEPRAFFVMGRVFQLLWVEAAGESETVVSQFQYGFENVFSKKRTFLVIREGYNYCTALPIQTYGGRGTSRPGVTKSEHAIIYTAWNAPHPTKSELTRPGEQGMTLEAIQVDPDNPYDTLGPMSRVNFGKIYTVEHNIKVKSYGRVNKGSMSALSRNFADVWGHTGAEPKYQHPDPVAAETKSQSREQPSNSEVAELRSGSENSVAANRSGGGFTIFDTRSVSPKGRRKPVVVHKPSGPAPSDAPRASGPGEGHIYMYR